MLLVKRQKKLVAREPMHLQKMVGAIAIKKMRL
jgi:hypothetical protein